MNKPVHMDIAGILSEGDPRSLGRNNEVVAHVLAQPRQIGALFDCVFHDDETIRMRASDALEKVSRDRPDLLQRYSRRLLTSMPKIDQPSVQWHLAQILPRLRLSPIERRRATAVLKRNLDHYDDWIVVTSTLEALAEFARRSRRTPSGLLNLLEIYAEDHRKSVAHRAGKLVAEFSGKRRQRRRRRRAVNKPPSSRQIESTRE